jgi:two-component system, OmpR family, catabolic regulation response regulator CreB
LLPAQAIKPCILIVEGEPAIANTLKYALSTGGFAPSWCVTAKQGLQQFAQALPALVILDVGLPDLNGLEVFKRMRGCYEAGSTSCVNTCAGSCRR